ncbi:MAG: hypothetical protein MI922_00945 [Bacteroidales bacterium]|nr:hypothetical protein [Bacteroidales bacterium]
MKLPENIKKVTTNELLQFLEHDKGFLIDTRPVDAYNGWKLQGEKRGGHIKGAKSLPSKWAKYIDWIEIVRSKGILPNDHLIIYGYNEDDAGIVAKKFDDAGYKNINIYPSFKTEWSTNDSLPMENLPRYKHLVPAQWVKELLDGNVPDEFNGNDVVICHAHYRNRDAYLSGHIPFSIDIDTLALESPETWNRRSPQELSDQLLAHGITSNTTVILYGKYMHPDNDDDFPGSAAGHIGAIRCAFIMMYAGVKDVRVLNGGFQSWKDAGYDVSTVDEKKVAQKDFGSVIPANPGLAVDVQEAKEMISNPKKDIVCVRSWPEYIGEVSGYNYIEKKRKNSWCNFWQLWLRCLSHGKLPKPRSHHT